jgi:hypothetical protein
LGGSDWGSHPVPPVYPVRCIAMYRAEYRSLPRTAFPAAASVATRRPPSSPTIVSDVTKTRRPIAYFVLVHSPWPSRPMTFPLGVLRAALLAPRAQSLPRRCGRRRPPAPQPSVQVSERTDSLYIWFSLTPDFSDVHLLEINVRSTAAGTRDHQQGQRVQQAGRGAQLAVAGHDEPGSKPIHLNPTSHHLEPDIPSLEPDTPSLEPDTPSLEPGPYTWGPGPDISTPHLEPVPHILPAKPSKRRYEYKHH